MQFMMNRYLLIVGLIPWLMTAQTNTITASPYSLFGVGVNTKSNIGINRALGGGGYALHNNNLINNQNPAFYAHIPDNTFLYDIGLTAELSSISSRGREEKRLAGNISSIAIASTLSKRSGFGLTLEPYSDVGYALIGVESNVEGSYETFVSNVFGSGGLNDLKLSYGLSLGHKFNMGMGLSYYFGTIKETQKIQSELNSLFVEDSNKYTGLRVDLGVQGSIVNPLGFGVRIRFPTRLQVSHDRKVSKMVNLIPRPEIVENTQGEDMPDFKLPLEIGGGVVYTPNSSWSFNMDFSHNFWSATDQEDNIGGFIDQNVVGIGMEYVMDDQSHIYWKRMKFRGGINYDSGYLEVYNRTINGYSIMAGIGIPLSRTKKTTINISYNRGQYGASQGILVKETLNTFNINLSLGDIWFLKRKVH